MVHAYVLVQTEVGRSNKVAEAISTIQGVVTINEVTGPYDVIVRIAADDMQTLGGFVVDRIQSVEGITRTLTCTIVHR